MTEEDIKRYLIGRITALPPNKKQAVRDILSAIKSLKGEGKTECDSEVFAKVIELEMVLEGRK